MFWNLIHRQNNLLRHLQLPLNLRKSQKNDPLRWRMAPIESIDLKELPFTKNPPLGQLPIQEPINYFRDIIGDELIAHIVSRSNIYASQIDINKPLNLTIEEL